MTSYRKLAVRSDRGHITAPAETFTSGYVRETSTGYEPVPDSVVVDTALTIVAKRIVRGSVLSSPKLVKDFLVLRLADMEHEIFGVLLLTTRHELIDFVELFRGCLSGASVHIKQIAKLALARNAAAVVLTHLHPLCFVWGVTTLETPAISAENHSICHLRKNGMGSCPVSSDRVTGLAVKALALLTRAFRYARSGLAASL